MSNPEDTASRVAPMKREVGQLRDHYLNPRPSEGLRSEPQYLTYLRRQAASEYDIGSYSSSLGPRADMQAMLAWIDEIRAQAEGGG